MASRLSGSLFQGRSTDKLLTEDAYTISNNETRNTLFESLKGIYSNAIDKLTSKASKDAIVNLIKEAKSGNLDKTQLMDRALSALGTNQTGLLNTLNGSLKTKLIESASTLIGDNATKAVNVLYGELNLSSKTTDIGETSDLLDLVADMAGKSDVLKIIDVEAESAVVGGLVNTLINEGLPEMMDDVLAITDSVAVKINALTHASYAAVTSGNLTTVNKVIDEIGLTKFTEKNPQPVQKILDSYKLDDATVAEYATKRTELVNTLTRVDDNWGKVYRNGEWVHSFDSYQKLSDDSSKLLSLNEPERTMVLAAKNHQAKTVSEVIKELYPKAYISS